MYLVNTQDTQIVIRSSFLFLIEVVPSDKTLTTLEQFIDREWIPAYLGGDLVLGDAYCSAVWPKPAPGPLPPDLLRSIEKFWAEHGNAR